jgi:hypothetical protein
VSTAQFEIDFDPELVEAARKARYEKRERNFAIAVQAFNCATTAAGAATSAYAPGQGGYAGNYYPPGQAAMASSMEQQQLLLPGPAQPLALPAFTGPEGRAVWNPHRVGTLQDHFEDHGWDVGAGSYIEYDYSARWTMRTGRRFTYIDRGSGDPRVGYYDPVTELFTALSPDESIIYNHLSVTEGYISHLPSSTW